MNSTVESEREDAPQNQRENPKVRSNLGAWGTSVREHLGQLLGFYAKLKEKDRVRSVNRNVAPQ